jgi:hypothetical protein
VCGRSSITTVARVCVCVCMYTYTCIHTHTIHHCGTCVCVYIYIYGARKQSHISVARVCVCVARICMSVCVYMYREGGRVGGREERGKEGGKVGRKEGRNGGGKREIEGALARANGAHKYSCATTRKPHCRSPFQVSPRSMPQQTHAARSRHFRPRRRPGKFSSQTSGGEKRESGRERDERAERERKERGRE